MPSSGYMAVPDLYALVCIIKAGPTYPATKHVLPEAFNGVGTRLVEKSTVFTQKLILLGSTS